jgi:hypothetical protein
MMLRFALVLRLFFAYILHMIYDISASYYLMQSAAYLKYADCLSMEQLES